MASPYASLYIVYHSGFGHTQRQAQAVRDGAAAVPGVSAYLLTTGEAIDRLDELDAADAIIFGCPTYMGSMSAEMKKFLEAAVRKWFTLAWKDKIAGAFTEGGNYSGDKLNTLIGLVINAMQHGMIYVGTGTLPAANEPASLDTLSGPSPNATNRVGAWVGPMSTSFHLAAADAAVEGDLATARAYGQRVATITLQFVRGRA